MRPRDELFARIGVLDFKTCSGSAWRSPLETVQGVDRIGAGLLPSVLSRNLEPDDRWRDIGTESKGDDVLTLGQIGSCLSDQPSLHPVPLV